MTGERQQGAEFEFESRNRFSRGIWSDGDVVYVGDEQDDKVYTYNIPDAIDARLASLSLSTVEIDEFSSSLLDYVATADHDAAVTAVELKASQETANVIIEPADADGGPGNGRQVELNAETTITITVTSEDGSRTMTDQVQVSRPSCLEGLTEDRLSEVSFVGGSISELEDCARSVDVSALFHDRNGGWTALFMFTDAPEFLSQPFRTRFPEGLPPGELLLATRQQPVVAPAGTVDAN